MALYSLTIRGLRHKQAGGTLDMRDAAGYRLDCCDECPVFAGERRSIASHRVRCEIFDRTVLRAALR